MKVFRFLVIFTAILLVFGIAFLIYSVHAQLTASEYQFQVDAVLSAAAVANQGESLTEPDKAVISEYEGQRTVIVPGNYTALSFYLRKDAAMPLFLNVDREKALKMLLREKSRKNWMPTFQLIPSSRQLNTTIHSST